MNKLRWLIIVLCLQVTVVFLPLVQQHYVRVMGEEVWLKMELFDPRDPLRGHYVRLQASPNQLPRTPEQCAALRQPSSNKALWYWQLEKGADGVATVVDVKSEPPQGLYLQSASEHYVYCDDSVRVDLPFERHYTNEYTAQQLEREQSAFLLQVWVYNGRWSLGELKQQ